MEAILFVGIQASGKSTFYKERFFNSHLRISNDLLKTKNREKLMFALCFDTGMPLVIDNTNASKEVRARYIALLKEQGYRIKCYYFKSDLERSLEWNDQRQGAECIPRAGIFSTHKRLEIPSPDEGFDELFYVDWIGGQRVVKEWNSEV
ncbi:MULTISPECIES: ATP-binding protein [unclassified Duganella]|uniref:ATP-binding protein n=1 Tax=unclassified Duganella TaxID=2636909 RepID=UPI0006FD53B1|nr:MULTISPECIES: ATP-binding protein [unclassified Duganella]KQV44831.1 kinase [Duganella sp. Root336D2]KRB83354.1 kinase [Duganella sp. Root198D2]